MRLDADGFARGFENVAKLIANRMRKSEVPDDALAKERRFVRSRTRAVNGAYFSCKLPTADTERMYSTPSSFIA
jgi:hypothetical protein